MEVQGYPISQNVFMQDNESAIKLETNGCMSAGSRSRHLSIRHFFISDRIKSENLLIVHCPTLSMLVDFFTKPLQGALFRKFKSVILGHEPISILFDETSKYRPLVQAEERVGVQPVTDGQTRSENSHSLKKKKVTCSDVAARRKTPAKVKR